MHPKNANHLYIQYLYRRRTALLPAGVSDLEFVFHESSHFAQAALLIVILLKSFSYYRSMLLSNESDQLFHLIR